MTTVDKSFDILQQVADHGPHVRLASLHQLTGIPKPTLHRMLRTMLQHGLIRQDSVGVYSIGSHLFCLTGQVYARVGMPSEVRQIMIDLQQEVNETIHVSAFQHGQLVYVEKLEASHAFQMISRVGKLQLLHSSAIGKAVLSRLPVPEARSLLDSLDMKRITERTIVDRKVLLDSLAPLRAQGYAVDDEEDENGLRAIGAAICDRTGYPTAGVSIVSPTFKMSLSQAYSCAPMLIQAARAIEDVVHARTPGQLSCSASGRGSSSGCRGHQSTWPGGS